ncbi:MAG TPA: asparagine synthase-related protein [Candidatus Solibacter sp.]|nr:asparagine synthase-related protein [Candidatus Solibacter sp.]
MTTTSLGPGAMALVSSRGDPNGAGAERVLAAFRDGGFKRETLVDGNLVLAWIPSSMRAVGTSGDVVCLLEGTLYEPDELRAAAATGRAVDLRGAAATEGPPAELVAAELLAAEFSRRGEAVLSRLRGDFWTVLWDRREARGIVACDQMGGRCPYWTRQGDDILVASDIPQLLAALPSRPGPDPVAMAHWLASTEAPPELSLFSGVHRLEAGHLLELGSGSAQTRRYWTPRYEPPTRVAAGEPAEALQAALARSLLRRTADTSDVGVLLSGGLDSSAVAALAAGSSPRPQPLRAYSAVFPGHPQVDETKWVDRVTAYLGMPSTRIVLRGGSALAGALGYLAAWKVPPTSPNMFFWAPLLERAGGDGIRVMLDGEGGDELFGISPYLLADRLRQGRLVSAATLATRFPGPVRPLLSSRTWALLRRFGLKGAAPMLAHRVARRARGLRHYAPAWMQSDTARRWLDTDVTWRWKTIPGPRWWAWQVDTVTRGLGPALVYEQSRRRAAMAGLEARHPLVDVDVVELALSLPPELAFDNDHTRPTLRLALAGMLPDEVRLRPDKSSFDAVFHAALAGPDLPAIRRILGGSDAEIGAYVDLEMVRRTMLDHDPPTDPASLQHWAIEVWRLVLAECWLQAQLDETYLQGLRLRQGLAPADYDLVALNGRQTGT